jgi:hypothetical protein
MISDLDIWRAANLLIGWHGAKAEAEAARLEDLLLDRGGIVAKFYTLLLWPIQPSPQNSRADSAANCVSGESAKFFAQQRAFDQPHLFDRRARRFQEPRRSVNDREAARPRDRHIQPVSRIEELDLPGQVIARRCCHRDQHDGGFLALEFVDGPHPSPCGRGESAASDLHVVGAHDQDVVDADPVGLPSRLTHRWPTRPRQSRRILLASGSDFCEQPSCSMQMKRKPFGARSGSASGGRLR